MAKKDDTREQLKVAVDLALGGAWDDAHKIVQVLGDDSHACWLHAVLHRIDGDDTNAAYWYRRAGRSIVSGSDGTNELKVISALLDKTD